MTLTSGQTYCLPSTLEDCNCATIRSQSPEYNSDPEGDSTHVRNQADRDFRNSEGSVRVRGRRSKREIKTATMQDLVKCVELFYLCLMDAEVSVVGRLKARNTADSAGRYSTLLTRCFAKL